MLRLERAGSGLCDESLMRSDYKTSKNIIFRQETSAPALREAFRLRASVWNALGGDSLFHAEEWTDEFDAMAMHWLAYVNGSLVAAARMSVHEELKNAPYFHIFGQLQLRVDQPIASINRLVVHPEFQGFGISREMDALRLRAAREMNCRTMTAVVSKVSGIKRLHALEKHGFSPVGPLNSHRGDWDWDWVTPMVLRF